MIITVDGQSLTYLSERTDWIMTVMTEGSAISITLDSNMGSYTFSSGINFDDLASFINEVKADCIARGINWNG